MSQRTREALQAKKAKGERLGRPLGPGESKLDPFRPEIEALLKKGTAGTPRPWQGVVTTTSTLHAARQNLW